MAVSWHEMVHPAQRRVARELTLLAIGAAELIRDEPDAGKREALEEHFLQVFASERRKTGRPMFRVRGGADRAMAARETALAQRALK